MYEFKSKNTSMKTNVIAHRYVISIARAWRRIKESPVVAERCMVGSFTFLVVAATSGNLVAVFGALAIASAAAGHLRRIEGEEYSNG